MDSAPNILSDIKKGNQDAFKEFFDDFYPILCSFANKYLKNEEKSKDTAQEALIKFWEKREDFNDITGAKSFLYVVVKNNCINILKKSKHNVDLSVLKKLESESFFKKNLIDKETFRIVRNAVNNLPQRQKEIVELSLKGLKNPEIATQLKISPHTVHTAKKNAYKKLKETLKDNYYLILFI
ncbi:RNA polymerase sigma factor [Aestuariivivens sediminis]|uniref:RNA polymerase sigma factor n=1 Tax=Aestuariivivens sediminis TaxID=2913557 RepID=UPI001F5AEDA3|nr:RNA polymerase sigma-70 factor [Aestuariivivens sediminis]